MNLTNFSFIPVNSSGGNQIILSSHDIIKGYCHQVGDNIFFGVTFIYLYLMIKDRWIDYLKVPAWMINIIDAICIMYILFIGSIIYIQEPKFKYIAILIIGVIIHISGVVYGYIRSRRRNRLW